MLTNEVHASACIVLFVRMLFVGSLQKSNISLAGKVRAVKGAGGCGLRSIKARGAVEKKGGGRRCVDWTPRP